MRIAWIPAYVGIGSNLDDPLLQIERALDRLAALPETRLVARSRRYRSAPLGPQDQPWFVNAAAGLLTQLDPHELLTALKALELQLGRALPRERWGPRRIDLDLLLYGSLELATPDLTVPHAGLTTRAFVLYPLADFAPEVLVPGRGRIADLARSVATDGLEPIDTD
ncbi:MAG TPA: 2-amino-4-hydroxy-6-hydroxymethyldihydropteridine diphosphokinase [Steroidobacteraceae bacterium]|nr:2-amino-4-hydroxy-6-hydroxymethyldihydropteridine diphosphokinase [Steroidobacteraceae bacterium]